MKKYWLLLVVILLLNNTGTSQTASDFYFNLKTGNYWIYQTSGSDSWAARTTIEKIVGTDTINGFVYYMQKGIEVMNTNPLDSITFHVFWLRQDVNGNILIGAYSNEYTTLDSAIILDPAQPLFSNEYLHLGFALHRFEMDSKRFVTDSVESISETISTPQGTYNNCIKIMELYQDTLGNNELREYIYYAIGVGEVQRMRDIPVKDFHTNSLSNYNIVTALELNNNNNKMPSEYRLEQNYPNPFNPTTTIQYSIPNAEHVTIKVYDILSNEVATLEENEVTKGQHKVDWNASKFASGVYYYRLKAGDNILIKKLVLLK